MMTNDELYSLICNTDKKDSWREEAVDELICRLAVDHLYEIVLNTNRKDSWRKKALDGICEISTLREIGISRNSITLSVGGTSVSIDSSSISVDIPQIADEAGDILYKMVNDTNRKDNWRYQCLKYLIKIGHKEYLKKIADNTNRKDSWRDEAMSALIRG